MSFGTSGPGGPKKDSIFSSIAPAAAPAPAPAPAPAARPSMSEESVSALGQRMEELEKNIISHLEKKIGEQLKSAGAPPPPPPPAGRPGEAELLFRKIEGLESRLADFSRSASLSASQLKNIEESKISARREIEDLLKAVREQQKYSELDRQMHDQLEKAWRRTEDLEKKLMEFYSSVLAMEAGRRQDSSAAADKAAASIDAMVLRIAGLEEKISALAANPAAAKTAGTLDFLVTHLMGLEDKVSALAANPAAAKTAGSVDLLVSRLAGLEEKISAIAAAPGVGDVLRAQEEALSRAADQSRRAQEEFLAESAGEARRSAAASEAAIKEMLAGVKENAASFKEIFDSYVRQELGLLRDKISVEAEALRREASASSEQARKHFQEQAGLAAGMNSEFEKIARANAVKAEEITEALEAAAGSQARALQEFAGRLGAELRAANADFAAALKKDGDEKFEKFRARYADALLSATFVEGFTAAVGASIERLEANETHLNAILKEVSPELLEKSMGVSGLVARSQYEAMLAKSGELKADGARLRGIKRAVEERFRDIFGER